MRSHHFTMLTLSAGTVGLLPCGFAAAGSGPVASGYSITQYANGFTNGVNISFDGGVMYIGAEDNGTPRQIFRVEAGGGPAAEYGDTDLFDPDIVLVDTDGVLTGVNSTVLVGGSCPQQGVPMGCIWAVLPDESTITAIGPRTEFTNVSDMTWDNTGRLIFSSGAQVFAATGNEDLSVLFTMLTSSITVAADDAIYSLGGGTIRIHDASGGLVDGEFFTGLPTTAHSLRFAPGGAFGDDLYLLEGVPGGAIYRVTATGAVSTIATGLNSSGMGFGPDGALYITHRPTHAQGVTVALRLNPCPGNIDGNSAVDFTDLLLLLAAWGNQGGPEDVDGSGIVDFGDLLLVLASWGGCP